MKGMVRKAVVSPQGIPTVTEKRDLQAVSSADFAICITISSLSFSFKLLSWFCFCKRRSQTPAALEGDVALTTHSHRWLCSAFYLLWYIVLAMRSAHAAGACNKTRITCLASFTSMIDFWYGRVDADSSVAARRWRAFMCAYLAQVQIDRYYDAVSMLCASALQPDSPPTIMEPAYLRFSRGSWYVLFRSHLRENVSIGGCGRVGCKTKTNAEMCPEHEYERRAVFRNFS